MRMQTKPKVDLLGEMSSYLSDVIVSLPVVGKWVVRGNRTASQAATASRRGLALTATRIQRVRAGASSRLVRVQRLSNGSATALQRLRSGSATAL